MIVKKICAKCGAEFEAPNHRYKFCEPCRKAIRAEKAKDPPLKAMRKKCKVCGAEFIPKAGNQVCCSRECSLQDQRVKQKERYHLKAGKAPKTERKAVRRKVTGRLKAAKDDSKAFKKFCKMDDITQIETLARHFGKQQGKYFETSYGKIQAVFWKHPEERHILTEKYRQETKERERQ